MIITTARKPSSKTRTFCKHLGRFTGWEYVTRGKTSREKLSDEPFLLVGEYKGNPGSLSFFLNGISVLSIHVSVSMDKEIHSGERPVIDGDSPLAIAFSKVTGLKAGEVGERVIRINDRIEFIDNRLSYIVLKVRSLRGEGIV
jgi:U3 small nucleolar ribonucleoprotein protein IMP4